MGWWEAENGLTLGDEPLDELHRSLRTVAQTYSGALDRPPTVAELELLLALVVNSLGAREVADLDGRAVTAVTIKTKKGGRRIAATAGDVFAVPLPDHTFGFGRVLSVNSQKNELVIEYFARRAALPVAGPDIAQTQRLGNVARVSAHHSTNTGRWPILFSEPGYRAPDHDTIRFQFWSGGDSYDVFDIEWRAVDRDLPRAQVPEDLPFTDAYEGGASDRPDKAENDLCQRLADAGV